MTMWTYLQIEAIPFLTLALTLYITIAECHSIRNVRRFQFMLILLMGLFTVDGLSWYLISNPAACPSVCIWLLNMVYFLLTEFLSYVWFLYVCHQVTEGDMTVRMSRFLRFSWIPLAVICALIVTTPWNRMIFYLDPISHTYERGSAHILQAVFGFGYMLTASVIAFRSAGQTHLSVKKKECRFLCFIALLPLVGGILQLINFNFVFLWSFTAAAAFLIFIDFQSHRISQDSLTSLNNRGTLESYLQQKLRSREPGWYLLMADIDRFKTINDKFGHTEGDHALQIVAQSMKNVFGKEGAFLSRYGGDEFVIIAPFPSEEELEAAVNRCREDLAKQTLEKKLFYRLQLSVGAASFDSAGGSAERLLQEADRRMYEEKRKHRDAS